MGKTVSFKILSTLLLIVFAGFTASAAPSDTECTLNPGSPACQQPFYTDDQSEYLFDLGASWAFNDQSQPDNTGPTVFYGANTGNLTNRKSDTVSGDTKTEQYIENTGQAENGEQQNWGRGNWINTDITITGSKIGSNNLGEYLINGPYTGECGDGIKNGGDTTSCPEDYGTPKKVVLSNEPEPERTIEYDEEPDTKTEDIGSSLSGYDKFEVNFEGNYSNEPDYHSKDGSIVKDTVKQETEEIMSFNVFKAGEGPCDNCAKESKITDNTLTDIKTGPNSTDSRKICQGTTGTGKYNEIIYSGDVDEDGYIPDNIKYCGTTGSCEISKNIDFENYESPGDYGSTNDDLKITWSQPTGLGDEYMKCTEFNSYNTSCKSGTIGGCRNADDEDYKDASFDYNLDAVTPTYEKVKGNITRYGIKSKDVWGPVNNEPSMFSTYHDLNVYNSNSGYHSLRDGNGKQNSNDQSVSANKYSLLDDRDSDYSGSGYFEAHRTLSNVADADGPDGGGNGFIAYHEKKGVVGKSEGVFESGYWNGVKNKYVSESDLPNIDCPGDSVRCVVSLDVKTSQAGWYSNPGFSIELE